MNRTDETKYDLKYHLDKVDSVEIKKLYKNAFDFARRTYPEAEVHFNYNHSKFLLSGCWFVRLYAQKSKMTIDVKGEFFQYPLLPTIRRGGKFKHEKHVINFHVFDTTEPEDIKSLIQAAYDRLKKLTFD